jgi:hypothetical protein
VATKQQVRDRAANDLGLLRLNQSLQAQDVTRIDAGYDEVYAALKKLGLATWASTAAVPAELVPHVVALVADNCLNTYGVSIDRFKRIKLAAGTDGETAKRAIRELIQPDYASAGDAVDF